MTPVYDDEDYKARITHLCADMVAGASVPDWFDAYNASAKFGWHNAQEWLAAMLHKVADGEITIEAEQAHKGGQE